MNDVPKISVIVPMYNVEKYLRRCLQSLRDQSFTDFEVLMIDDESPDRSARIARAFSVLDDRFVLYRKKNGGLSDARNYGIERAKGEFIAFVDSDDHVHKDFLKTMYNACVKYDADMAYCLYRYSYFNTGLTCPRPSKARAGAMDKEKALDALLRDSTFQSYAWNKLYRRKLFTENNIRYPYMYFEDIVTSSRLLHKANRLAVCKKYLYFYEKRFGSIVGTMNAEKIGDYWRSILAERNYFQAAGELDKYKDAIFAVAKKARYINVYSIVRQHLLHLDFRRLRQNLNINKDIYAFVISDDYVVSTEDVPELPCKLIQPGRHYELPKYKKFPI